MIVKQPYRVFAGQFDNRPPEDSGHAAVLKAYRRMRTVRIAQSRSLRSRASEKSARAPFDSEKIDDRKTFERAAAGDRVVPPAFAGGGAAGAFGDVETDRNRRAIELVGEFGAA